jgi:signal transduction histidine kinase
MQFLTKIDLKFRLALRVAAISAFCLVAALAFLLFDHDRAAHARLDGVADVVARELTLQLAQAHWVKPAREDFPDLQRIAPPLMAPGLCIFYRDEGGEVRQSLCGGAPSKDAPAPAIFSWLYGRLFDPGAEIRRPVIFEGRPMGAAAAAYDPASQISEIWRETSRLFVVLAVTLSVLCLMVYAALARALRPTRLIRNGLERLAANDLAARLPVFDLAELSEIRTVFNGLAEKLETTLAERRDLTRRLIAVQDEERRRLARELHDEFGQCLAAIGAVAASMEQTARVECPTLVAECESIARTAARMMASLRSALTLLRPPELDEMGLAASLEHLVAGWRRDAAPTRFAFEALGDFDRLPPFLSANLYRVAQEALTNAAKHADAAHVTLRLAWRPREDGMRDLELIVSDDGLAGADDLAAGKGLGLVGMRERVAALDGTLEFETRSPAGLILRVAIPARALAQPDSRDGSGS